LGEFLIGQMNRSDLMELARIRLKEADVLLQNDQYDGAYYLSGYVVECGLKACIAKQTNRYDFPDKEMVNQSYTHSLTRLVKVAGLALALEAEMNRDSEFANNWAVVKDWSEGSRYERHAEKEVKALYVAITNRRHGVLKWIRQHW
jgi:HEPN domain-containing protein